MKEIWMTVPFEGGLDVLDEAKEMGQQNRMFELNYSIHVRRDEVSLRFLRKLAVKESISGISTQVIEYLTDGNGWEDNADLFYSQKHQTTTL